MLGYVVRPVEHDDLSALYALSTLAGPGFTSLQPELKFLDKLISKSVASFKSPSPDRSHLFFLVMEELDTGGLVGCASVKTNVGTEDFMCADFILSGENGQIKYADEDYSALNLERTLQGYSEVGSLYLHPSHRASGAGRFLARARYYLMASSSEVFCQPIVAQLRGWCDEKGKSPFFDAVWAERLAMSYEQSDKLLARDGAGNILRQFQGLRIELASLPHEARSKVGVPHPTAAGALKLLNQEGFNVSTLVDLADGGPIVVADPLKIRSTQQAQSVFLMPRPVLGSPELGMVARRDLRNFRTFIGELEADKSQSINCPEHAFDTLRADPRSKFLFSSNASIAGRPETLEPIASYQTMVPTNA